jgi:hypothetical protein
MTVVNVRVVVRFEHVLFGGARKLPDQNKICKNTPAVGAGNEEERERVSLVCGESYKLAPSCLIYAFFPYMANLSAVLLLAMRPLSWP